MKYNKVCNLEDWCDQALATTMRRVLPYFLKVYPDYPQGKQHRKHWEYAHVLNGLDRLGATHEQAFVLSVAGGHEEPAFDLTNRVRWVFVTDIYGTGGFKDQESNITMLTNPDAYARCPYNRNRLVVEYMNALDLRFEENTFDGVLCLSSIEHFGGIEGVQKGLAEMRRVLKPGGIAAITTECIINGASDLHLPGLSLFAPKTLLDLAHSSDMDLVDEPDLTASRETISTVMPLQRAIQYANENQDVFPMVALELEGRIFTSAALFLRKP